MGSNNYGEIVRDEKRIEELEQGIGFDWTLGYADKSGYLVQSRPITYPDIPDAQDIEQVSTTTVIDAVALSKLLMESDDHEWIDWGNGMVGLGIDVGDSFPACTSSMGPLRNANATMPFESQTTCLRVIDAE